MMKKAPPADIAGGARSYASKTVSRVLYLTVIYLGALLPERSSHMLPTTVLLRIEFTATDSLQPSGALLPHLSTLTGKAGGISLLHFS